MLRNASVGFAEAVACSKRNTGPCEVVLIDPLLDGADILVAASPGCLGPHHNAAPLDILACEEMYKKALYSPHTEPLSGVRGVQGLGCTGLRVLGL